jgi:hypothetical protein
MVMRSEPPRLSDGVNVSWKVPITAPSSSATISSLRGSASIASKAAQCAASAASETAPRERLISSPARSCRIAGTSVRVAVRKVNTRPS